jgi:isopentenyldiphosphate isomerase
MRIPIVDEQDNLICYKDAGERDEKKELTRTSALWIVSEDGDYLIAKRSIHKKYHPGLWGQSVTGTNEEGETYESNIIKEAKEELGIDLDKITLGPKQLVGTSGRSFFAQHFFSKIPKTTKFIPREFEVDEVKWIPFKDLENWFLEKPEEFSSHFPYSIEVIKNYQINLN